VKVSFHLSVVAVADSVIEAVNDPRALAGALGLGTSCATFSGDEYRWTSGLLLAAGGCGAGGELAVVSVGVP
jgi:hypothetical protein